MNKFMAVFLFSIMCLNVNAQTQATPEEATSIPSKSVHVCTGVVSNASTSSDANTQKTSACVHANNDLKDHVCSADCKEGVCVYVHGEKQHACTAACIKE